MKVKLTNLKFPVAFFGMQKYRKMFLTNSKSLHDLHERENIPRKTIYTGTR
jgi:hypothetical protein